MSVNIRSYKKLNLTVIVMSDYKNPGFTALVEEPHIISEGETEEKAIQNLFLAFHDVIEADKSILKFQKIL